MKRPDNCRRIHFTLDGTIALARQISPTFTRTGDTASGYDIDDEEMLLWRCKFTDAGVCWEPIEPWTQERLRQYVAEADLLYVVTTDTMRVVEALADKPTLH